MTPNTRLFALTRLLGPCLALGLAACATPLAPGRTLEGAWEAPRSLPGSSFLFNLKQFGDTLWGTGTYAIEAGASGTLAVAGRLQAAPRDTVTLVFTPDLGGVETFVGILRDDTTLSGTFSQVVAGQLFTGPATFIRTQ